MLTRHRSERDTTMIADLDHQAEYAHLMDADDVRFHALAPQGSDRTQSDEAASR